MIKKLVSMFSHGPLHLVIIFVALIWIFPSVGLLITSFRSSSDVAASGWWTVF